MSERNDPWRFIGLEQEPETLPLPTPEDLGDQLDLVTILEQTR